MEGLICSVVINCKALWDHEIYLIHVFVQCRYIQGASSPKDMVIIVDVWVFLARSMQQILSFLIFVPSQLLPEHNPNPELEWAGWHTAPYPAQGMELLPHPTPPRGKGKLFSLPWVTCRGLDRAAWTWATEISGTILSGQIRTTHARDRG